MFNRVTFTDSFERYLFYFIGEEIYSVAEMFAEPDCTKCDMFLEQHCY